MKLFIDQTKFYIIVSSMTKGFSPEDAQEVVTKVLPAYRPGSGQFLAF